MIASRSYRFAISFGNTSFDFGVNPQLILPIFIDV